MTRSALPGRLAGKRAIVTGAGRGIGLAIAMAFLQEGARVLVNDVQAELL
ncbi:MAG: short-chain dehydrogenase, partial [Nitrospiraceae bacterium]